MLTHQNVKTGVMSLTWRDATVLHTLLSWMVPHPQPVAVIALQECSQDFLKVLDVKLGYGPFRRAESSDRGDAVLIYHSGILNLTSFTMHQYSKSPFTSKHGGTGKPVAVAIFERKLGSMTGPAGIFRVVAGKCPGNPVGPHLKEYCQFLKQLFSRVSMRTLIVGDFNFLEEEVLVALTEASLINWNPTTSRGSGNYPTNIQPEGAGIPPGFGGGPLAPKRIDHVLQIGGLGGTCCRFLSANDVLPGLQKVVDVMTRGGGVTLDYPMSVWEETIAPEACVAFLADTGPPTGCARGERGSPPNPRGAGGTKLGGLTLERTASERVALQSNVTREMARVALNRPEVAFSPQGQEQAAVEWLLHQDINNIADILAKDTGNPLTSPGPFRKSPFPSREASPAGSPGGSPHLPPIRPSPLDTKVERRFALSILTPTGLPMREGPRAGSGTRLTTAHLLEPGLDPTRST